LPVWVASDLTAAAHRGEPDVNPRARRSP
jgi:hypothetical protein